MPLLVEIKEPEAQEAVRRVLVQEGAAERCVVASEHQEALQAFDEPPFVRGASGAEISALYWAVFLRRKVAGGEIPPALGSRAAPRVAGADPRLRRCRAGAGLPGARLDGGFAGHRAKAVAAGGGGDRDERARESSRKRGQKSTAQEVTSEQ